MSWSLDNKTMYWTNTSEATIFAFDFDEASGDVSNKRPFFCPDDGNPDGHAQDEQGNLWVALWGGGKVVRVSPQGQVTAEVKVPTRCPTVCPSTERVVRVVTDRIGRRIRRRGHLHHQRSRAGAGQVPREPSPPRQSLQEPRRRTRAPYKHRTGQSIDRDALPLDTATSICLATVSTASSMSCVSGTLLTPLSTCA